MKKIIALLLWYSFTLILPSIVDALIARGVGPITATAPPGTTCTMVLAGTTTGRMLVIVTAWGTPRTETISSITVSGESDATLITGSKFTDTTLDTNGQIAYLAEISAGGTKTVTITYSGTVYASCGVQEYSGQDIASQPDASTSVNNFDTTGVASCNTNITTATANALIVAYCLTNGDAPLAGSGYTLWGVYPNVAGYEEVEDNLNAAAPGSKAATFTNPYNNAAISVASFKIAGGGGGGGGGGSSVTHRRIQ